VNQTGSGDEWPIARGWPGLAGETSVLGGRFADPCLVTVGDRFYLYPTTDGYDDWGGSVFTVHSSDDLVHWHHHGPILTLGVDVEWASNHAWAPAMIERDGRFYFYFSADKNIGVAVGDSPTGPFRDSGRPLVAAGSYDWQMIDPAAFIDEDGTPYLIWGSGQAYIVPLNEDMISFDATKVITFKPGNFREAAWIHRHRDTYFLTWSENDTREAEYCVAYATGPGPMGPWTERGTILQQRPDDGIIATGHHSIAEDPRTGEWYIAYHRFALNGGNGYNRETVIDRLLHLDDGTLAKVVPSLWGSARR
jgi:beta-xylosidase